MADTLKNVKITQSGKIPTSSGSPNTHQFDVVDFSDIEVVCLEDSDSVDKSTIEALMRDKKAILIVSTIKEAGLPDSDIVSGSDATAIGGKPCAVLSPAKTIMPQIITPSGNVEICDNGLTVGSSTIESHKASDGFEWKVNFKGYSSSNATVADSRSWGVRETQSLNAGYISMAGVRNKVMDFSIVNNRRYDLNLKSSGKFGDGACVVGYQFLGGDDSGTGSNNVERAKAPHLLVSLNDSGSDDKKIKVSVNQKNGVYARVGNDVGQGTLVKPQGTVLPPNCKNYEDKWNCLFMYPLYSGFVVSSEAMRSLSSTSDNGIFIPYSKIKPVFNNLIYNPIPSDSYLNTLYTRHPSSRLELFPPLFTEGSVSGIGVSKTDVNGNDSRIYMDSKPYIEWEKSYGKFFYSPLFFQPKIKMTLWFFGESKVEGSASGVNQNATYKFYPIVTRAAKSDNEHWSGTYTSNGSLVGSPVEANYKYTTDMKEKKGNGL